MAVIYMSPENMIGPWTREGAIVEGEHLAMLTLDEVWTGVFELDLDEDGEPDGVYLLTTLWMQGGEESDEEEEGSDTTEIMLPA